MLAENPLTLDNSAATRAVAKASSMKANPIGLIPGELAADLDAAL
ncbi:MAG: hypothetical protein ABIR80_06635 [Opitutaceae bacterium]